MTSHRNAWSDLVAGRVYTSAQDNPEDPASSTPEDPATFMHQVVIACTSTAQLCADRAARLTAGIHRWFSAGGSFDSAMGWVAPVGKRNLTVRGRVVTAAKTRALKVLVLPVVNENPNQQAEAILPIVCGDEPPSVEAASALAALRALGADLPRSKPGLYALIKDLPKS